MSNDQMTKIQQIAMENLEKLATGEITGPYSEVRLGACIHILNEVNRPRG